jgi:polysaccharide export outer membrane protein
MPSSTDTSARRRRRAGRLASALLVVTTLAACVHQGGHFVWVDDLPDAQVAPANDAYMLAVGDRVSVQVFGHPEMSGSTRVREDGKVSIPLLGDVAARGKALPALGRDIEEQLGARNLVVAARATVLLEEPARLSIPVLGEVSRPGLYQLEPGVGLAEVLASAGGFTEYAHRDRLYVVRRWPEPIRIRFTYESIARAEGRAAEFRLRQGDVVVAE